MTKTSPIAKVVLHPVRLRIVQQLGGRQLTTSELRSALPDVTQATLYRHVAALIDAEIVTVVDERRVRGTVERTLALGDRMAHVGHDDLAAMSDAELRNAFVTFLGALGESFDKFIEDDDRSLRDYLASVPPRSTSPPTISRRSRAGSPTSSPRIALIPVTTGCASP